VAEYDFQRCNVLLVEDNAYIRTTFEDMLRHFKFGQVATAANGEEAIDYLRTMGAGSMSLDMVFSDLVMTPINGLLLLRWIRAAKDSPNRMLPVMMISGAADQGYVNSARDLGVTEFIAKPFSVTSVYERILKVVDYPRKFITTQNYFGPDRRRRRGSPPADRERRQTAESDVVVVYSADKIVKPEKPSDVWYWKLPNSLKEKVASGVSGANVKGEMPMDLIEVAEKELKRAALDFATWALEYLAKLSDLCTEALLEPGRRSAHFSEIHTLALELRGQGGTFGYPLITTIGKMLYDCTIEGCREDDTAVEIVKCHIDSMRAIIREKVAGDGGKTGKQLIKGLRASIERVDTVR